VATQKKLFLDQNFVLILNLKILKFYLYPNSSYCKKQIDIFGWVRKRNVDIVQNNIQFYQAILKKKYLLKCQK